MSAKNILLGVVKHRRWLGTGAGTKASKQRIFEFTKGRNNSTFKTSSNISLQQLPVFVKAFDYGTKIAIKDFKSETTYEELALKSFVLAG